MFARTPKLQYSARSAEMLASSRIFVLIATLAVTLASVNAQTPQINISLPADGMLLRANVPVFGSVRMPRGTEDQFKIWYLEYGAGPNPDSWVRMKESTELLPEDPWAEGKIKWDPNKEPPGNITNWAVGLQSYNYGNWRQNLNGLYTLRLVAETKSGKKAELRHTHYVGEAIMRTVGGTALSADKRCRLLVPPFAFAGEMAHVVTIIRQVPGSGHTIPDLIGVEDTRTEAQDIYKKLPKDSELLSAIYRIYPNGLYTEPAAYLEIDYDPKGLAGLPIEPAKEGVSLRQYNPVTEVWDSLPTTWFAKTARAELGKVSDYSAYVAMIKRTNPAGLSDLGWTSKTALSGYVTGKTEPFTAVTVKHGHRSATETADHQGTFRIPFILENGLAEYTATAIPPEGEKFASTATFKLTPGAFTSLSKPTLMATPTIADGHDYLLLSCEDQNLRDYNIKSPRSTLMRVMGANRSGETHCELSEEIPGSAIFTGRLRDSDLVTSLGRPLEEPLVIQAGATIHQARLPDTSPPAISLSSPTHPCLLFATVNDPEQLKSSTTHSLSRVQKEESGWRITGIDNEPSARMTFWPVKMFSTDRWSIVGFTYRLYQPTGWQLMLRQGNKIEAFHFGSNDGNAYPLSIPMYAKSEPLLADGKWNFWQSDLASAKVKYISQILFGSWKQSGYYRIDPGFSGKTSEPLSIREIFIGRTYPDPTVNLNWTVTDRNALKQTTWWVDQNADSLPPELPKGDGLSDILNRPKSGDGSCQFTLPKDGRWFFHIVATDAEGNQSPRKTYPLFIYQTKSSGEQPPVVAAESPIPQQAPHLVWQQPEGKINISLPGFGSAIDPKTLRVRFLDHEFPITTPIWDAGREILTLDATAFKDGAPLGFDGETAELQILAKNPSGEEIADIPLISVKFDSPLKWRQTEEGGKIDLAENATHDTWIAGWRNPDAPWRARFPGTVNNVLLFTHTFKDERSRPKTMRWLRPLKVEAAKHAPIFEKESLASPQVDEITQEEAARFPILRVSAEGNPAEASATASTWAYKTEPLSPFDQGFVRVISRTAKALSVKRIPVSELKRALDFQQKNETLRIDAWLPPGEGKIDITAPGKRRILYGHAWDTSWESSSDGSLKVISNQEWTRVSIVLVATSDFQNPKTSRVSGNVYW